MNTSFLKAGNVVLSVVIGLGVLLSGHANAAPGASTPDPAAKEKEFLSDPDVAVCELEETTISRLDLPRGHMVSFIHSMKRANKEDVKQARMTLANRPLRIVLGERPDRDFYLYDTETGIGPYWWGTCGYTWRVPTDMEITGDEEELTVTVTYDTQKLYGKVSAQRKIIIRK